MNNDIFFKQNFLLSEENAVNYIAFMIIEFINIIILIYMLLHKFEIKKSMLIGIGIYIIISVLILVYRIQETVTPTGENTLLDTLWNREKYRKRLRFKSRP